MIASKSKCNTLFFYLLVLLSLQVPANRGNCQNPVKDKKATNVSNDIIWEKQYPHDGQGITDICPAPGGGVVCIGKKKLDKLADTPYGKVPNFQLWLVHYDVDGNVVREFQFGDSFYQIAPYNILLTKNGEYVITAGTYKSIPPVPGFSIYRVDASGNVLWDSTYFGYLLTHSSSLAEDQDGDILLMADKALSNKPKAVFTKSGDRNDQKTWPVDKLQPGSASICPKCPPNSLDFFATAVPSPAGGYFLGGFCSQAFMDNSGKLLWCKKLENYEVYRVIRQIPTSDGGVVTLWQGTKDFPRAVISRFSNSGAPEWVKPIDGQKSKVPLDLYKDNQEQYMILGIHPGIVLVKADGSVVKTGNSLPYEEEDAIFQATDDNFFLFKKQDEQKSKNARLRKVKRGELKPLPESKIQVEPSSVDFGVIKKGSEAKMEIKVTNISGQPVKLYQRSSCGCMNSTLKGKSTDPTLKPAESAVIEIQISTSNLAKRMATLKLTVFSPAEEEIIIPVKFEVIE